MKKNVFIEAAEKRQKMRQDFADMIVNMVCKIFGGGSGKKQNKQPADEKLSQDEKNAKVGEFLGETIQKSGYYIDNCGMHNFDVTFQYGNKKFRMMMMDVTDGVEMPIDDRRRIAN